MDLASEKDLVSQAKKDPEAFGQLFDANYQKIFSYILKRTGNVSLAEDLTSDTFFKAMKNLNKFSWKGISISAWFYRIATNEISSYFRKHKGNILSLEKELEEHGLEISDFKTPESELVTIQNAFDRHQHFLKISQILDKLDVKYQEVLSLRFFEHKKIGEIAKILGKREGTVKSLLSRGLSKLRAKLEIYQTQPFDKINVIETEAENN